MSFSIAIFPFLKTSGRFYLGRLQFRSTDDVEGLPDEQRDAVREVAEMLFLKDDLKIASATFALLPPVDIDRKGAEVDHLADVRAIVAYAYSSPHDVFDNILLSPEEVSLLLLTPGEVSSFLVYPEHHTVPLTGSLERRVPVDERHMVRGYSGLYNFTQPLWVASGSRIYPPKPQATLNISQDMAHDFVEDRHGRSGVQDLLRLLNSSSHPARARAFTALRWYNHANESAAGPDRALLNLAVAFEALFNLPENAKSERLADAISLILGRTDRILEWATQFYAARSRVAHEGTAGEIYYRPAGRQRSTTEERFGSLMLSGRAIFQSCMSTLLFGMATAEAARLGEKLVSNAERFTKLCELLDHTTDDPGQLLAKVAPIVREIEHHRFVSSTMVAFDLMLGALSRAATTLLRLSPLQTVALEEPLRLCALPRKGRDLAARLDAVRQLAEAFKAADGAFLTEQEKVVQMLAEEIWRATFPIYYALQREEMDT